MFEAPGAFELSRYTTEQLIELRNTTWDIYLVLDIYDELERREQL